MCPAPANPTRWTTRALLEWMANAFRKAGLDSPRLMGEMLLSHVLGCERLSLYTQPDRPAADDERERLRDLVARALRHEPVQYLVGEGWFFSLPMRVDRRVLVPRPSTETMVEHALQHARAEPGFGGRNGEGVVLADVCTGSGAIAIAMLKNLPGAHAIATDISPDALDVALENAQRHNVHDRLDLAAGDLLEPVTSHPIGHALHFVLSNPPYIPDDEWPDVDRNVKDHEPEIALRGGPDGMRFVAPLIANAPARLRPGGLLLVEVASSRAEEALAIALGHDALRDARIVQDHEGLPRVIIAHRR